LPKAAAIAVDAVAGAGGVRGDGAAFVRSPAGFGGVPPTIAISRFIVLASQRIRDKPESSGALTSLLLAG
jgi:hypothetical protein